MKIGKDIDSVYRDRLSGAKMPPPQDAWENILSHLPEKEEKKKLFPLWMKLVGVAAILALIFTLFKDFAGPSAAEETIYSSAPVQQEFQFPEVSTTFSEIMTESGILLQTLILSSVEMEIQEKDIIIAAPTDREVLESTVVSKGAEMSSEADASKITDSGTIFTEEILAEELASSGDIAEASSALQQNEPEDVSSKEGGSGKKFKLSTRVAPVYFNNFGGGNAVESAFAQKDASGEVTFSYGVNIAYEVSKKLNVRSGIHKVGLAYNTREISFKEVVATASFDVDVNNNETLASPSGGTLNQKMGFFEVPLEVEYVILDKKLAVGLVGGGSVLILEENQVSLSSLGKNTDLGETNSMNKLSFTTNLGLSLGYDVTKQLELSLEPVVKLPLNTFKNSENSNPYFFGIYSGFSYKF